MAVSRHLERGRTRPSFSALICDGPTGKWHRHTLNGAPTRRGRSDSSSILRAVFRRFRHSLPCSGGNLYSGILQRAATSFRSAALPARRGDFRRRIRVISDRFMLHDRNLLYGRYRGSKRVARQRPGTPPGLTTTAIV